jgi:hypothetical protein
MSDAQKFLLKKQKKRDKKPDAKCLKCSQYTSEHEVCKQCSFEMVVQLLARDDEGFKAEMEATIFERGH